MKYIRPFVCAPLVAAIATQLSAQSPVVSHLREMMPLQGDYTRGVALGDMDADGDLDLFTVSDEWSHVYLYEDATGYTEELGSVAPIPGSLGVDIALADFSGDGAIDALLAQDFNYTATYLQGDSAGGFDYVPGAIPILGPWGSAVDVADLDNDGDLDAFVTRTSGHDLVLRNDGGAFGEVALPLTSTWSSTDVALGDMDHDGDVDAVIAATDTRLLLGDGALGFVEHVSVLPAGGDAVAVSLGDFDADGNLDVVVGNDIGGGGFDELVRGDGALGFTPQPFPGVAADTTDIVAVDYDGDLDVDVIATTNTTQEGPILYENQGPWTFVDGSSKVIGAARGAQALDVGDIDGDGDVDMVVGGWGPNMLFLQSEANELVDVSQPWPNPVFGSELVLGDWDLDGFEDAAVLGQDLDLFLNDGAGGLVAAPSTATPAVTEANGRELLAGDFDGDGDEDLLLVLHGEAVRIYDNDGAGNFTWDVGAAPAIDLQAGEGAVGDLDGDGDLDVYLARGGSDAVLRNDGAGNFSDEYVGPNFPTAQVALGDLDGDGDLDVFCGRDDAFGSDDWFRNDGNAFFSFAFALGTSSEFDVVLFDLEGDGDLDVVSSAFELYVHTNLGSGIFVDTSGSIAAQTPGPSTLAAEDFDGDGDIDVYSSKLYGSDTSFLLWNEGPQGFAFDALAVNSPAAPRYEAVATDLDLDGDVDVLETTQLELRLLHGLARQVARRADVRIGKPLALDVFGPAGELWFLAYSPNVVAIDLGGFGTLRLDPTSILVLGAGVLDADGTAGFSLPFPYDLSVVGLELGTQAAVGDAPVFTNLERIVPTTL